MLNMDRRCIFCFIYLVNFSIDFATSSRVENQEDTTTKKPCGGYGDWCQDYRDCCSTYNQCHNNQCFGPTTSPPPYTTTSRGCADYGEMCQQDADCCQSIYVDSYCHNNQCYEGTTVRPTTTTPQCSEYGGPCYCPGTICDNSPDCCDSWNVCAYGTCYQPTTTGPPPTSTTTTRPPPTSTTTTRPPPTTTTSPPPTSGCSYLLLSTGSDFPDSLVTCFDTKGKKIERTSEDMIVDPDTSCIFLSSGHLGEGFEMEFFCNSFENFYFWTVNVRSMN